MKIRAGKIGFWLIPFSKIYFDACFHIGSCNPWTRRVICANFQNLIAKTSFYKYFIIDFMFSCKVWLIKYCEYIEYHLLCIVQSTYSTVYTHTKFSTKFSMCTQVSIITGEPWWCGGCNKLYFKSRRRKPRFHTHLSLLVKINKPTNLDTFLLQW